MRAIEKKQENAIANAKAATESTLNSALTIQACAVGEADVRTLLEGLYQQTHDVMTGDMRHIETMLMTQAKTLDTMFHKMLRMAVTSDTLIKKQTYCDLGFKAQNQCRKALLALTDIKHPKKATFIKQQNNAINQRVNNNHADAQENNKTEKFSKPKNELLSEENDAKLDIRRTTKAITIDS